MANDTSLSTDTGIGVDTGTSTDETVTTDEGTQKEPPVIPVDANFHEITLDVKKSGQTINEPIVIRTDDTDDVIEVHLKKDGQPLTATSATFYGTKQDLTIIANDPATVDGDTITYSVPKELANIGGKIKDAYFMIDGKITTENFVITVIKTVTFLGESKDYIPGLNNLIDKWNDTSLEWTKKLKDIDQAITDIDSNKMINDKMNGLLETAKTDYMATFNKSVDDLNNVVKDLSSKEDIATAKGEDLDKAIDKVNQSISDVNTWLKEVQDKIITANTDFTKAQQDSVAKNISTLKESISDVQKTADGLKSQLTTIDGEIKAIDIPDLNAKVDSAITTANGAKTSADTANTTANNAIAKFESYYTKTETDKTFEKQADLTVLLKTYVLATALNDTLKFYPETDDVKNWIATSANQTKKYAEESIKAIVGAAPETMNTIAELATAVTENKTGVEAINSAITNKADKTDVDSADKKLQSNIDDLIVSISDADYQALDEAGTVDPKKLYVTPEE